MQRRQLKNLRKNISKTQKMLGDKKKRIFRREELLGQFMAKKLFEESDKRYNKKYWGRLERSWR